MGTLPSLNREELDEFGVFSILEAFKFTIQWQWIGKFVSVASIGLKMTENSPSLMQ